MAIGKGLSRVCGEAEQSPVSDLFRAHTYSIRGTIILASHLDFDKQAYALDKRVLRGE